MSKASYGKRKKNASTASQKPASMVEDIETFAGEEEESSSEPESVIGSSETPDFAGGFVVMGEGSQEADQPQEEAPEEDAPQEEAPQEEAPQEKEAPQEEAKAQEDAPQPEEEPKPRTEKEEPPKPPRFTPVVYAGSLIVIILICFLVYYLHARQEPGKVVREYLSYIKALDFEGMQSLLAEGDLGALEDADLGNAAYEDFFRDINSKMTYSVTKTNFRLGSDEARVTAHIHHIDGTQLYEKVLSDFLLGIVSSAFSGETISQDETEGQLAGLLSDTYAMMPETYTDTEISYPLVKTEEGWRIASLDEATVKVMSANFKSIQEEIQNLLTGGATTRGLEEEEGSSSVFSLSPTDVIRLSNERYEITYSKDVLAKDLSDNDCLLYYYTYTNLSDAPSSAINDVSLKVFQDGKALSAATPNDNESALDAYYAQVKPGDSILVCQAFALPELTNVSVQATNVDGGVVTQVIRIQQ